MRVQQSTRRVFLSRSMFASVVLAPRMKGGGEAVHDPWSKNEMLEPPDLARLLSDHRKPVHVFCVTFPVLYRQRHVRGAEFAGPGNSQDGLNALRRATAHLQKDADIVLYCGCCPMVKCPNIRPAFSLLKNSSFKRVHVLNLPTSFHADWAANGYPVET